VPVSLNEREEERRSRREGRHRMGGGWWCGTINNKVTKVWKLVAPSKEMGHE